ncbi:MAG: beta-lactamase family protein [Planctomycetia bacterium]|nr:beta-lactamase family protein [Planctomycetia bacterium]
MTARPTFPIVVLALAVAATSIRAQERKVDEIPVTGRADEALAVFDDTMLAVLRERKVPGAALAVVKDGRLVLARGYGFVDPDAAADDKRQPVQPDSLFRIASLSKPLTAVAVLQLVERGQLSLDTHIWDVLKLSDCQPAAGGSAESSGNGGSGQSSAVDPRWRDVTIAQLLRHTGGFDRGASFDPMFRSREIAGQFGFLPPAEPRDVIRYMTFRPLDFEPGARYAYSNFGYCLLGRAIETVSGTSYEAYVQQRVLAPLSVRRMKIGQSLPEGRADGEVRYSSQEGKGPAVVGEIGQEVPHPYGAWYLEAMDSHGGWIASAVDLARFVASFTDEPKCLLSKGTCAAMVERPNGPAGHDGEGKPKDTYYGLGWFVRTDGDGRATIWHTGSLPGTATLMLRRHDNVAFVVLFNARSGPDGEHLGRAMDPKLNAAAEAVKEWPAGDLFGEFR